MSIKTFNKLVRDGIPQKLAALGKQFSARQLSEREFLDEVKKKIEEEACELAGAPDRAAQVSELADVYDVLDAFCEAVQITDEELAMAREKSARKGLFFDRVFLEWTEDDGYSSGK